jgi:hypothetical protein
MRRIAFLTIVLGSFIGSSTSTFSQEAHVWSDVDCGQSNIVVPAEFKCRATQEYSGGQGNSTSDAGGRFRRWTATGMSNNAKAYYLLQEGVGTTRSQITATETLEQRIKQIGSRTDKNFTQTQSMAGGDYVRYESAGGTPCVGIRKYGPSTTGGFKWIIVGTLCGQKGKVISDQDIASFMASANYRG